MNSVSMKVFLKGINPKLMKKLKFPESSGKIFFSQDNLLETKGSIITQGNKKIESQVKNNKEAQIISAKTAHKEKKNSESIITERSKLGGAVAKFLPLCLLPLTFHTGICLFDSMFYGTCYMNSFKLFFKHSLLLNSFLTGINATYIKRNSFIDFLSSSGILTGSMGFIAFATYCFVNVPMHYAVFFPTYFFYMASNWALFIELEKHHEFRRFKAVLVVLQVIMAILIATQYSKYKKSITDSKEFEKVIAFYELSNDSEFKKVMDHHEELLEEIDIKFEKTRD